LKPSFRSFISFVFGIHGIQKQITIPDLVHTVSLKDKNQGFGHTPGTHDQTKPTHKIAVVIKADLCEKSITQHPDYLFNC